MNYKMYYLLAINAQGLNAMITKLPFFGDKNSFLQNGYFVLGADTFKRLLDTRYYSHSYEHMIAKLAEFTRKNNKIIVAPRVVEGGQLSSFKDFKIPEILKDFAFEVENFRMDISSSEIRQMNTGHDENEKKQ